MLGRLRMDVKECIDVYLEMADKVFSKVHRLPVNLVGRTHGRYNQEALQEAIENVLERKGLAKDTLLKDEDSDACKTLAFLLLHSLASLTQPQLRVHKATEHQRFGYVHDLRDSSSRQGLTQ